MKNIRLQLIVASLTILVGAASCSCSSTKNEPMANDNPSEITFEAEMAGDMGLRATDNRWGAGDAIGIYMLAAQNAENILAENKHFSTQQSSTAPRFLAASNEDKLRIPKGKTVDFVAYHPYHAGTQEGKIPIDLSQQTDPAKINLMTADNLQGISSAQGLGLSFVHRLSKLVFVVGSKTPSDLQNLSVRIEGMPTKAIYDVLKNSFSSIGEINTFSARVVNTDGTTQVEALVLPDIKLNDAKVVFNMASGRSYTWSIRQGQKYSAGKVYRYNVNLKGGGGVQPGTHPFLELPEVKEIPNSTVVTHYTTEQKNQRNYTMLYDRSHRLAYWVAYPLHPCYIGGVGRTDKWAYDPVIPVGQQYDLRRSFQGGRYDRGHQLPSGDRTSSKTMNEQTFYYSNMTAQFGTLNRGQWQQLETKVRQWMMALSENGVGNDTLYVVTGAALSVKGKPTITLEPTQDNSGTNVSIPQYYYKALAKKDKQGMFHTIAFLIPNEKINKFDEYKLPVAELESLTGFKFFPGIPSSAKSKIDSQYWQ